MSYSFPHELFPDVRAVIGQEVSEAILPDDMLALPTFIGQVERFISKYLTDAQISANQDTANTAAVYYFGSIMAPTIPEVVGESIAGGNISFSAPNYDEVAEALKVQAVDAIAQIDTDTGQPVAATNPNIFTKAPRKYW